MIIEDVGVKSRSYSTVNTPPSGGNDCLKFVAINYIIDAAGIVDDVEKFMTTPRNLAGKNTHLVFTYVFTICMYSYLDLEISAPGASFIHIRSLRYPHMGFTKISN
jgi:hypothetical protein